MHGDLDVKIDVRNAILKLDPRSVDVLIAFAHGGLDGEAAVEHRISKSRVAKIRQRAIHKIRQRVEITEPRWRFEHDPPVKRYTVPVKPDTLTPFEARVASVKELSPSQMSMVLMNPREQYERWLDERFTTDIVERRMREYDGHLR